MIDLLNTVLGDMEDVYHKSWSGVAGAYEVSKPKSFFLTIIGHRQQSKATVLWSTTCIDKISLYLELSSYASLKKCGWATPNYIQYRL